MKHWKSYLCGMLTALLLCGMLGTAYASTGKVMQELEYRDIRVTLDGKLLDLRNAKGDVVEPFMFGGTNYLPVRALSEALGLDVKWDGKNATVVLTHKAENDEMSPEEVFQLISPATVEVTIYDKEGNVLAIGSGFFIDDQGTLVTNYHVVEYAYSAAVTLSDKTSHPIRGVVDYSEALDLAILRTGITGNSYLTISETDVRTGDKVYTLGSSKGLTGTFSEGIVSTASRELYGVRYIQITAPISQGNSGGPLVDRMGHVVGVNAMSHSEGQNLNFAVDITELNKLDRSAPLSTMTEFYNTIHPSRSDSEDAGFYDMADSQEEESNDVFFLADKLENGKTMAGEVSTSEDNQDIDWFYLETEQSCTVEIDVVPYYAADNSFLACGLVELGDEGLELVDIFQPIEEDGIVSQYLGIRLEEPGVYFLVVFLDPEYAELYDDPVYYIAKAVWD